MCFSSKIPRYLSQVFALFCTKTRVLGMEDENLHSKEPTVALEILIEPKMYVK